MSRHGFIGSCCVLLGLAACGGTATQDLGARVDSGSPLDAASPPVDSGPRTPPVVDSGAAVDSVVTDAGRADVGPAREDAVVEAGTGGPTDRRCVTGVACDPAMQPHCISVDVTSHEGSVCECTAGALVCRTGLHAAAACAGGIGRTFPTPCTPNALLCETDTITPFPTCDACACDATGTAWYCGGCHAIYAGHEF